MTLDRSPTEITAEGGYWLRSRDVSDSPRIGGDEYLERHDVTRPEAVTAGDLPPADDDAVRAIDRDALDEEKTIGKWQITGSAETVEDLWPDVVADAADGVLWAAKAMTAFGREELPYDNYLIVVYTPDYFEKHDVDRVREHLRDARGVTHELLYKPDIYTAKGIVAETAEECGLSMPARYPG